MFLSTDGKLRVRLRNSSKKQKTLQAIFPEVIPTGICGTVLQHFKAQRELRNCSRWILSQMMQLLAIHKCSPCFHFFPDSYKNNDKCKFICPSIINLHSEFSTGDQPFLVCDVILGCTICVTLFITFYASLIHILIVTLFLRTGYRREQQHKKQNYKFNNVNSSMKIH